MSNYATSISHPSANVVDVHVRVTYCICCVGFLCRHCLCCRYLPCCICCCRTT